MDELETTVPSALVAKMKSSSKGINIEQDRIQGFGIKFQFDGISNVKLQGGNSELREIAVNTLERKYGQKEEDDEFVETLGDGKIEWTILGESSIKFVKLYRNEIEKLRKLKTVKYKATDGKDKLPKQIDISCELKDFESANEILKPIKHAIEKIEPDFQPVEKKDETKAVRFCDKQNFAQAFCMFEKEESELKIYGKEKKNSEEVFKEWQKLIEPSNKSSIKMQPKADGAPTVTNGTIESKRTGQARAEMSSLVQSETSRTDLNGSKENEQDKAHNVNLPNQDNSVRSKQDTSNNYLKTNTSNASSKSSVSERSNQKDSKSFSQLDHKSDTGSSSNGATAFYPKGEPGKKSRDGKYEFMMGKMKVLVYKYSIIDLKGMDAVVNAANEKMMHGGGVAYHISKAAGKKMDEECYDFIKKHGSVKVTENFVSRAGDMKCKGIIHAVGPQWHDYRGRREECAKDVYLTVLKCLQEMEKRKWKKLALIAISSGIFGVPKQLCAEMYIKAMIDNSMNDPGSIEEIHFVDINQDILDIVEKAHKSWVDNPNCLSFKNALNYEEATSLSARKTLYKKEQKPEASFTLQLIQRKQDFVQYKVYGMLDLLVYTGSVLDVRDADTIVCSMNTKYEGGLLSKIYNSAGKTFEQEFLKRQSRIRQPKDKQLFILPGGMLKVNHVMAIVIEDYIRDTTARDLGRLNDYYEYILLSANEEKMARVVLPLVGVVDCKDIRSCCEQLIKTILNLAKDVNKSGKGSSIKELRLINLDPRVTGYLIDVLKDVERGDGQSYQQTPVGKDYPWIDTVKSKGWILHVRHEEESTNLSPGKDKDFKKTMKSTTTSKSGKNQSTRSVDTNCHYFKTCNKKAKQELDCGHAFCGACEVNMKKGCKVCLAESRTTKSKSLDKGVKEDLNECSVCFDSYSSENWETLECGHGLCTKCFKQVQKTSPRCPTCNRIFGILTGNQPDGQLHYKNIDLKLPGYPQVGAIHMLYTFQDGTQKENHPNPGQRYRGTQRQAYLPNNTEGQKVFSLLKKAFNRRLMFTIGESRSSGKGNHVTFNDIHLKTSPTGGPEKYGYPDPEYLTRVQEELRAKGVTE